MQVALFKMSVLNQVFFLAFQQNGTLHFVFLTHNQVSKLEDIQVDSSWFWK